MKIGFVKIRYYAVRFGVALVSVYIALFLAEIALWRMEPKQTLPEMYRGLYNVRDGRPVLKPGYYGRFDIGSTRGEVRVNSYGYRGHEPSANPRSRVLLIGDSFTFGALLDQKDTIDVRMEEKEPGLEVANLGVIGYNLPEQLGPLREWTLPANKVVYLFFNNDFQTPLELTIMDGYPVPRFRNGKLLSDDELRMTVEKTAKRVSDLHKFSLISSLRLPRLKTVFKNAYTRFSTPYSYGPADWWPQEGDRTKLVPRALAYTREMRDLAVGRNMDFQIAIIPSVEEVRERRHHPLIAEYIAGIRASEIPVIDLLQVLSTDDYWSFDPHFNPKGAKVAADQIYKALKGDNPQVQ